MKKRPIDLHARESIPTCFEAVFEKLFSTAKKSEPAGKSSFQSNADTTHVLIASDLVRTDRSNGSRDGNSRPTFVVIGSNDSSRRRLLSAEPSSKDCRVDFYRREECKTIVQEKSQKLSDPEGCQSYRPFRLARRQFSNRSTEVNF
jgi:hypothetical protein